VKHFVIILTRSGIILPQGKLQLNIAPDPLNPRESKTSTLTSTLTLTLNSTLRGSKAPAKNEAKNAPVKEQVKKVVSREVEKQQASNGIHSKQERLLLKKVDSLSSPDKVENETLVRLVSELQAENERLLGTMEAMIIEGVGPPPAQNKGR